MPRIDNSAPTYYLSQILALLAMIEDGHGGAPAKDLAPVVGIGISSFKRYLARAEADLGVVIAWDRTLGYVVSDWGLLNKQALMERYHGGGFVAVINSERVRLYGDHVEQEQCIQPKHAIPIAGNIG